MRTLVFLVSALFATAASAQPVRPPKLVIAISVDQYSADLFDEYRPRLTGGLARLATGSAYRNGYQGQNATETCPGHSTILTGALPSRSGIIANNWFDLKQKRSDKGVYCAEDERVPGSSSSGPCGSANTARAGRSSSTRSRTAQAHSSARSRRRPARRS